jgi:O-antigen/teichoic acid export membrane protein
MDLILPVILYFVSWQCQEAARRGILAEFRHKAAIPGDVISYLGQVAMIFLLIRMESLTLANVFYAMASTAALSAVIQLRQAEMVLPGLGVMRRTMRDFASIGGWSLANNVAATLRIQIFPWILTILHGPVAVAPFQAALNVANVANPLLIGLCNIIPQTAAQAHSKGKRQAWLAARPFILVGIPPAFLYCALVLIAPTLVLQVMYGSGSPYIEHTDAVRLLILAWIVSYAADMTCSYLHGVDAPKVAFRINALGAVMAFVLAVPLVMKLDLIGACIALLAASVARLAVSQALLSRLFANERLHPA